MSTLKIAILPEFCNLDYYNKNAQGGEEQGGASGGRGVLSLRSIWGRKWK